MYFPRNWEFGSALSNPPLGTPVLQVMFHLKAIDISEPVYYIVLSNTLS
jgi:hypothetical protein